MYNQGQHEKSPVGGRSLDLAIGDAQRPLLVRPAGNVYDAAPGRQSRRQQPAQQERAEVIYPQLLVLPMHWRDPNDACLQAYCNERTEPKAHLN